MESAKCGGTVDAAGRQDTETEPDMKAIAVETGAERSAGTPYSGGKKPYTLSSHLKPLHSF